MQKRDLKTDNIQQKNQINWIHINIEKWKTICYVYTLDMNIYLKKTDYLMSQILKVMNK